MRVTRTALSILRAHLTSGAKKRVAPPLYRSHHPRLRITQIPFHAALAVRLSSFLSSLLLHLLFPAILVHLAILVAMRRGRLLVRLSVGPSVDPFVEQSLRSIRNDLCALV